MYPPTCSPPKDNDIHPTLYYAFSPDGQSGHLSLVKAHGNDIHLAHDHQIITPSGFR